MSAKDVIKTKNYAGTFTGGQGPILGMDSSSEPETKGVFGGEGKTLKSVDEGGHDSKPTGDDHNFDLQGKSYAGPENWQPSSKAETPPDEVSEKKAV
jgi:hypothetical protein